MVNEEHYIALILKSFSGELTDSEKTEFNSWLESDDKNQLLVDEYKQIWVLSSEENDFEPDVNKAWNKFELNLEQPKEAKVVQMKQEQPVEKKSNKKFLLFALAASVVLLIGVTVYMQMFSGGEMIQVQTASNQKAVTLPDGSIVTLNANSSLAYNEDFNKREVEFKGEAFFNITKNPENPFVISSAKSQVKVLGTSFNVDARPEKKQIQVIVKTGKVQLSSSISDSKQVLVKGEQGVLDVKSGEVSKLINTDKNYLSWKDKALNFSGLSYKQIFADMEEYFGIKVNCSDANILSEINEEWEETNPKLEEVVEKLQFFYEGTELSSDQKTLHVKQ